MWSGDQRRYVSSRSRSQPGYLRLNVWTIEQYRANCSNGTNTAFHRTYSCLYILRYRDTYSSVSWPTFTESSTVDLVSYIVQSIPNLEQSRTRNWNLLPSKMIQGLITVHCLHEKCFAVPSPFSRHSWKLDCSLLHMTPYIGLIFLLLPVPPIRTRLKAPPMSVSDIWHL